MTDVCRREANCAASGVPVQPAVTGMVVDVEPGLARIVSNPEAPAWVPPQLAAPKVE